MGYLSLEDIKACRLVDKDLNLKLASGSTFKKLASVSLNRSNFKLFCDDMVQPQPTNENDFQFAKFTLHISEPTGNYKSFLRIFGSTIRDLTLITDDFEADGTRDVDALILESLCEVLRAASNLETLRFKCLQNLELGSTNIFSLADGFSMPQVKALHICLKTRWTLAHIDDNPQAQGHGHLVWNLFPLFPSLKVSTCPVPCTYSILL
jgi:hypothetical protein